MSAGVVININIQDVIEWLTAQKVKYPTGEIPYRIIIEWLDIKRNEKWTPYIPKPKVALETKNPDEELWEMFFPPTYDAAQFFDTVIDTINTIDESDINLLDKFGSSRYYDGKSNDKDKFKQKFEPVFTLFKDFIINRHSELIRDATQYGIGKIQIRKFFSLLSKRLETEPLSLIKKEITGKSIEDTSKYIKNLITKIIIDDIDSFLPVELHSRSRGILDHGSGAGGGRRPSRKSSATKRHRPRRRTARK